MAAVAFPEEQILVLTQVLGTGPDLESLPNPPDIVTTPTRQLQTGATEGRPRPRVPRQAGARLRTQADWPRALPLTSAARLMEGKTEAQSRQLGGGSEWSHQRPFRPQQPLTQRGTQTVMQP